MTTFYVKTETTTGETERSEYPTIGKARDAAAILRRHARETVRRIDVCRDTGRIVDAWDRDAAHRWNRSI